MDAHSYSMLETTEVSSAQIINTSCPTLATFLYKPTKCKSVFLIQLIGRAAGYALQKSFTINVCLANQFTFLGSNSVSPSKPTTPIGSNTPRSTSQIIITDENVRKKSRIELLSILPKDTDTNSSRNGIDNDSGDNKPVISEQNGGKKENSGNEFYDILKERQKRISLQMNKRIN
ncbi:hypothetical protein LOTGIDRAFT_164594 [Lottia gigantea]|uniref:Uncharacterized protein n=1 Tax=Lottia gigantea TaxID=225164 RepID=V4BM21_LOTGI|nr:hypothetical protein LOTGIDRAFT_164594 [Lottia gigantea]ESO89899.1 hypothetical protein LOTGIDRAFT_164594 [Lottia gigantea]